MRNISVWQGRAIRASNWFLEEPYRLVALLTMLSLIISMLGVLGYISGLDSSPTKFAPSPGGGTGGSGSPSGPG